MARTGPQEIRRVHIPKPGTTETRPLGIPTVRDRIVQAAVVNVIEPIFERDFAAVHCAAGESDASRVVLLLPAQQLSDDVPRLGRLAANAPAQYSASAFGAAWPWSRQRSSSLEKRLLRRTWAVQFTHRPCRGRSILTKVTPSTGEPDAGDPHVRFGGRGVSTQ